jgi:FecR protein
VFTRSIACFLTAWLVLSLSNGAMAAEPSGHVTWLHGPVTITDVNGNARKASTNEPIEEGETIRTGSDGLANIRFIDGGIVSLRTATALQIERYSFHPGSREEGAIFLRLIQGGVRSITGLIAKTNPDAYMLETPTALLGVRGTDHETYYVPATLQGAPVAPGTYERVHAGATLMQGSTQAIEIAAGHTGYAGIDATRPEQLATLPPIYRSPAEAVAIMASPDAKRIARQRISAVLSARPPEHTSGVEPWERTPPRMPIPAAPAHETATPAPADLADAEVRSLALPPNFSHWMFVEPSELTFTPTPARSPAKRPRRTTR